jgi:hypothetical protein
MKILVEKPRGKCSQGRRSNTVEDNIKIGFKELVKGTVFTRIKIGLRSSAWFLALTPLFL